MADRLHNRITVKPRRKRLRRRLTPAEATLWLALKSSKVDKRKFRRQHSVGPYILDFYCVEEWLAIELDGEVHMDDRAAAHDARRRRYLNQAGIKVLRFENWLVFDNLEQVVDQIKLRFGWKETGLPANDPGNLIKR